MNSPRVTQLVPIERVERLIHLARGEKVLLDADLARLYDVETKALNRAVRRNLGRFPADFMFQLTAEEAGALRCQIGTSKTGRGGRRYATSVLKAFLVLALLTATTTCAADYAIGADLSFLKQAEERGTVFKDEGKARPGLEIFKEHGYNWIRLRLFHTPTRLPNNLEYTIASAQAAKKLGFKFLLDFHYSDTWADPAKQIMPKAWEGKSHEELVPAARDYTRDTIGAFREAGVLPEMVQIGNEVRPGMLWPDGKLPENWKNFAELLSAGIQGVEAGSGTNSRARIMIHFDQGANRRGSKWFYDKLNEFGVKFDVIGLSYYPWWHGSLLDLRENLNFLAKEYHKDIMLVEVAYCWRPTEYRNKLAPFPETPEGQRDFLDEVNRVVLATPDNRGIGIMWWEPAVTGSLRSRGFFDDDGNALPVIRVFDRFTRK